MLYVNKKSCFTLTPEKRTVKCECGKEVAVKICDHCHVRHGVLFNVSMLCLTGNDEEDCQPSAPFGPGHLNIKSLFAAALGLHHELGLDGACSKIGMTMEGTHHRGDDDAWNIAGVLCQLLDKIRNGL